MKRILTRSVSLGWLALSVFLVLTAISVSLVRVLLPLASDYRDLIQAEVSAAVGRTVRIEAVKAEWKGLTPRISLKDLKLFDEQTRELLLSVGEAYISIDLQASLISGKLVLDHLGIVGVDLTIRRKLDGVVVLHGMEDSNSVIGAWIIDALITSQNSTPLNLLSSRVHWVDEIKGFDYQFSGVNLSATTKENARRLSADIPLPKSIGNRLTLVVNFQGRLRESNGWNGRLFAHGEGLRVNALPSMNPFTQLGVDNGAVSFQIWSDWKQGRLTRLTGEFNMHDTAPTHRVIGQRATETLAKVEQIRGKVQWNRRPTGWFLQVADLEVALNERDWPRSRFSLEHRSGDQGRQTLRGAFSYVNLQDIQPFLKRQPRLQKLIFNQTDVLSLSGELEDVQVVAETDNARPTRYTLSARIQDFGFSTTGALPAISGFDGQIRLDESGGELKLHTHDMQIDYPAQYSSVLTIDDLRGNVSWRREGGRITLRSESFALSNKDIEIHGTGMVKLGGNSPYLDVRLSSDRGNGSRVVHYLPKEVMTPAVYAWLKESILDAQIKNAETVFRGYTSDFPFLNGEGEFHASIEIESGRLDYITGWPMLKDVAAELNFRNRSLSVAVSRARMLGLNLSKLTARIGNFDRPVVNVDAEAHGPFDAIVKLLDPLYPVKPDHSIVKSIEVDGPGGLSLNMRIPLSNEIGEPKRVQGLVVFEHTDVRISDLNLAFDDVNGAVHFGPEGITIERLQAVFRGNPVHIAAMNQADGSTLIKINGQLGTDALLKDLDHPFKSHVEGVSEWFVQFNVPHLEGGSLSGPLALEMWSDLKGTAVSLPVPLSKARSQYRKFKLKTSFARERHYPVRINYGRIASAVGMWSNTNGKYTLKKGEIRFNQGEASLPARGLLIRGMLPEIDLNHWILWYQSITNETEPGGRKRKSWDFPLDDIDLKVDRLAWGGNSCEDFTLRAHKVKNRWLAKVEGSLLKGDIVIPMAFNSGIPLVMNLEYLKIKDPGNSKDLAQIDPRRLPALRVETSILQIHDLEFSDVRLETTRIPDGVQVHNLQVSTDEFVARLSGDWRVRPDRQQRSKFRVVLKSEDLGVTLKRFNIENRFDEGVADSTLQLQWPDTPYRMSYNGLYARANIKIKNGNLIDIEPGPGRVLGLVNLSAISRRLTLDFRDFFSKGFAYDEIEGNFSIVGSDVYTNDLTIDGPSAQIAITGRTGLDTRDYDQVVTVTPQLGSGLPIAGAILGGPGIGAAVFIADRLFKHLGPDIDKMTRFKYRVSGSWDTPVITQVELPQHQDRHHPDLDDG